MLFDLRGRGRRRTVQGIYLFLALLIGIGLVGFGIGGGFGSGGLFNAVTNSSGGASGFSDKIKADQKAVALTPNNAAAWAALAHDSYADAGATGNYDTNTGTFTPSGRKVLATAKDAWNHYLALNPNSPDPDLANLMVQAFSAPGGLNDPGSAVRALQIVIAARPPTLQLYETMAVLSYQAGNVREGDLAAAKAVSLAPKAEQAALQAQFAQVKKNPSGNSSAAGAAAAATPTSTPAQTVTVPASKLKNLHVGGSGTTSTGK